MAVTTNYGAAPTYVKLASQTLTSITTNITFSNIPQGYTDLVIHVNYKANNGGKYLTMTLNGDSATNYSRTELLGNGTSATSQRLINEPYAYLSSVFAPTGEWATFLVNLNNYSNSTTFKTILTRGNNISSGATAVVNLWRSTTPITTILLTALGSGYDVGSTFTIYGIKAALVPKATGGDIIVQDGQYWYHAFRTTGVFVPRQSLTADILRISGGGGGGYNLAGGGGAGGVVLSSSQALTSVTYTATVGAGGTGSTAYGVIGGIGSQTTFTGGVLSLSTVYPGGGGQGDYGAAYASASTVASGGGASGAAARGRQDHSGHQPCAGPRRAQPHPTAAHRAAFPPPSEQARG
jgi:hypothetical protein